MEGISHEACSLAGTLGLVKLIAFWDDNGISIDSEKGSMQQWFTDDTPKRFEAYGWHVIPGVDGHDPAAIDAAIAQAKAERARPTLICCKTVIAKGAPKKANTGAAHGAPLGADEVAATRANIGWKHPAFEIPQNVYAGWDARERGAQLEAEWNAKLEALRRKRIRTQAAEFRRRIAGELPARWREHCRGARWHRSNAKAETIATRKASQNVLEALGPLLPELIGGSADLAGVESHDVVGFESGRARGRRQLHLLRRARVRHGGDLKRHRAARRAHPLLRDVPHVLGLRAQRAAHGGAHEAARASTSSRTTRSGWAKTARRTSRWSTPRRLRLIPNMDVWRPCDTVESASPGSRRSSARTARRASCFTRQNLPFQARTPEQVAGDRARRLRARRGERRRAARGHHRDGLRSALAIAAQKMLAAEDIPVRVVSMPSTSVFDRQDALIAKSVLPRGVPRVAVEAGVSDFWRKYVGLEGAVVGIDRFGESAPAGDVFKFFGFTAENVANTVRQVVQARRSD